VSGASYALAERIAWLVGTEDDEDVAYVTTLPDGPPLVLRGPASLIFRAVAPSGTREEIVARVAEEAGLGPDEVRDDVVAFLDTLAAAGIVARG